MPHYPESPARGSAAGAAARGRSQVLPLWWILGQEAAGCASTNTLTCSPVLLYLTHPIPSHTQGSSLQLEKHTEVNLHTNLLRRLRTTNAYCLLSRSLTGTERPLGGDVLFLFVFVGGEADTEIHLSSSDSFPIWPISGHKRTGSPMKVAGT